MMIRLEQNVAFACRASNAAVLNLNQLYRLDLWTSERVALDDFNALVSAGCDVKCLAMGEAARVARV